MLDFLNKELKEKIVHSDYNFVITGASGWIGTALSELFLELFESDFEKRVFLLSNSKDFISLSNGKSFKTIKYNYSFDLRKKYVFFHLAFLTKDKQSAMSEKKYIEENNNITKNVKNILLKIKPKILFYASSGAVYENNNLYSQLKIKDEYIFKEIAKKINSKIIIPRIFNIAGPFINKISSYAISDFINQLISNKMIIINSNFLVTRSYIHIFDLLNMCLSWMFDDKTNNSITFDTGNVKNVELGDLAKNIVNLINKDCVIARSSLSQNVKENLYCGNLENQLKLCKKYSIMLRDYDLMILDTYKYILSLTNENK